MLLDGEPSGLAPCISKQFMCFVTKDSMININTILKWCRIDLFWYRFPIFTCFADGHTHDSLCLSPILSLIYMHVPFVISIMYGMYSHE